MTQSTDNRDKVHKKLRTRVMIYAVVSLVVLIISTYHIVQDHGSALYSFIGLVAGTVLGVIVSRMNKISWDKNAMQVISSFDALGIVILVLYVAFEIYRERIVSQFVDVNSAVAVSFAVLAGLMLGRVLGIRGKIRQIFTEEGIL
jgi:hypothetical protein